MPLQRLDLYSALHFTRLADAQDPLQLELPPKPGNPLPTASRIPIHNVKDQISGIRHQGSEEASTHRRPDLLLVPRISAGSGGADRDRTGDPLLAKQVLSQLSYGPVSRAAWLAEP